MFRPLRSAFPLFVFLVLLFGQGTEGKHETAALLVPAGVVLLEEGCDCHDLSCDECLQQGCRHVSSSFSPMLVAAPGGLPMPAGVHGVGVRLPERRLPASPVPSIYRPPWS